MWGLKKPCNCPEEAHDIFVQVAESIKKSLVIREKGKSQNEGNKKTKHAKFLKKEHFLPPDTRMCDCQGVNNIRFSESLACFVFLLSPFWDLLLCIITNEIVLLTDFWPMFPFYNPILYNLWFPVAFRNIKWELQPEILLVETAKVYMIDQTYFKNQGKCLTYSKTASYFGNTSGSDSPKTMKIQCISDNWFKQAVQFAHTFYGTFLFLQFHISFRIFWKYLIMVGREI